MTRKGILGLFTERRDAVTGGGITKKNEEVLCFRRLLSPGDSLSKRGRGPSPSGKKRNISKRRVKGGLGSTQG